jgi:hypothetical protein
MKVSSAVLTATLLVGVAHTGCDRSPVDSPLAGSDVQISGWYTEHDGQLTLQPCGKHEPLRIVSSPSLAEQAHAFGPKESHPVYVRVRGVVSGGTLTVSEVEQFGSPEPVSDCAITGMVFPDGS